MTCNDQEEREALRRFLTRKYENDRQSKRRRSKRRLRADERPDGQRRPVRSGQAAREGSRALRPRHFRPARAHGPPPRRARRARSSWWPTACPGTTTSSSTRSTRCSCPELDRILHCLITDLEDRGLLDHTLVIAMGEFGRTPVAERRARPRSLSECLEHDDDRLRPEARRRGRRHGRGRRGSRSASSFNEQNLFATIFTALGIDPYAEYDLPGHAHLPSRGRSGRADPRGAGMKLKLTLDHDHQAAHRRARPRRHAGWQPALYAACMDGAVYAVDLATGATDAFRREARQLRLRLRAAARRQDAHLRRLRRHADLARRRPTRQLPRRVARRIDFGPGNSRCRPDGRRAGDRHRPVSRRRLESTNRRPKREPSVKVFDTATGELVASLRPRAAGAERRFQPRWPALAAGEHDGRSARLGSGSAPTASASRNSRRRISPVGASSRARTTAAASTAWRSPPMARSLLCCGMGPMTDPMAGNGKMTWQRWDWRKRREKARPNPRRRTRLRPHGNPRLSSRTASASSWPAGRPRAPGTPPYSPPTASNWSHSLDTKKRITTARFTDSGTRLILPPKKRKTANSPNLAVSNFTAAPKPFRQGRLLIYPLRCLGCYFFPANSNTLAVSTLTPVLMVGSGTGRK